MKKIQDGLTFSEDVIPYGKLLEYCYGYGSKAVNLEGRTVAELHPGERVMWVRKTHQGWKEAQIILIQKILEIENEQVALRKQVNGKIQRLPKDKQYIYDVLERHKRRLKDFADGIVWQIYGLDKSRVRAGIVDQESYGFLIDKNLESGISYINDVNEDPNSFAILSDITTVLGIGDVLQATDSGIRLVELKEGGKNAELLKIMKEKEDSLDEARQVVLDKYAEDTKTIKQFERMVRQKARADETQSYEKDKSSRPDHILKQRVEVVEFDHADKNYLTELERLCEEAIGDGAVKTAAIDNCLFVAALPGAFDIEGMFLMKHEIYHRFMDKECHALGKTDLQHKEFEKISEIRLERLDSGFAIHGMTPVTLNLSGISHKVSVSILAGDLKVYTYLHLESFISLAEQMDMPVTRPRSRTHTVIDRAAFSSDGKDVVFKGVVKLVDTNYAEICFGFDSPRNMLEKIKLSIDEESELAAELLQK